MQWDRDNFPTFTDQSILNYLKNKRMKKPPSPYFRVVDVDECSEDADLCGVGKFCIDTPGSYLCSCVPWYQKDLDDSRCVEWAGLVDCKYNIFLVFIVSDL